MAFCQMNRTYKQCFCFLTYKTLLYYFHRLVEQAVIIRIWAQCPMSGHSFLYGGPDLRQGSSSITHADRMAC